MSNLLQKKVGVVTGANRGIGKCITETFAENGANIIACIRTLSPETEKWMQGLETKFNISINPVLVDLSDEISEETVLENLNEALEKAVSKEEYEAAARLRDRIKQLEKKSTSH